MFFTSGAQSEGRCCAHENEQIVKESFTNDRMLFLSTNFLILKIKRVNEGLDQDFFQSDGREQSSQKNYYKMSKNKRNCFFEYSDLF